MEKFILNKESQEFELGYGTYRVYFTGGWYVENLNELEIELIDIKTNETITLLASKDFFGLRRQDWIEGKQAVAVYSFFLDKYSNLRLVIKNPQALIMKRYHPFLFLFNLLYGQKIPTENMNIIIK